MDKDFFEAHRADLTLHQAARDHFDSLGYGKNNGLPTINSLKQEWATLESEKRKLYHGYRELKDRRTELLMAKNNAERLLGINNSSPERTSGHDEKNRRGSHER
jgi:predicted nuclease with TOPRIM domain